MIINKYKAFTLLELLIAMAIFGLISIMSFSGLSSVLTNKEKVDHELQRISNIQRTMLILSRDLEQIIDRPIRDGLGGDTAALLGGQNIDSTILELTRSGWRNPANQTRSQLQRVAYSFEDNQLIRLYWYHLDHIQSAEPIKRVLLDDVENIELRYLNKEWSGSWPELDNQANQQGQGTPASNLPQAIEIKLELKDWGTLTRLFRVAL